MSCISSDSSGDEQTNNIQSSYEYVTYDLYGHSSLLQQCYVLSSFTIHVVDETDQPSIVPWQSPRA